MKDNKLKENGNYTFDCLVKNLYNLPLGTKITDRKNNFYELKELLLDGKVLRKFSRINDTKLRFMTYNNVSNIFYLLKDELLTEEEKEFLKDMCKYYDIKTIYFNKTDIGFYNKNHSVVSALEYPENMEFNKIERYKYYTLEELGLEE